MPISRWRAVAALILSMALVAPPAAYAQDVGLSDSDIAAMRETLREAPSHGLARFGADIENLDGQALVARTIAYARAQRQGQVRPSALHSMWHDEPSAYDPAPEFDAAVEQGRLAEWLETLPPPDPRYQTLVEVHAGYQRLAAEGGWPATPDGPALELGDSGPAVSALRERLSLEGFTCDGAIPGHEIFDAALDCAVRAYQDQRGIEVDGVVGPETRAALNVPAAARARQIEANLERWRWLPRVWPAERMEVNTGGAEAVLFQRGEPAVYTRIIAGKPSTPTPTFVGTVTGVLVNPPWIVPASIARNELLPRERREPGYLARNRISRSGGQLVQSPGDHNSLGRVKLDMPNPYTVYLHDTPARALFDTARRYYSHGCMRMQRPREVAAALLGWTSEMLDAAIDAGATETFPLGAPVPVYVFHHTAFVRQDGVVALHPDVYGWDARLLAALDAGDTNFSMELSDPRDFSDAEEGSAAQEDCVVG